MKPSPHPADDELGRLVGLSLSRQQVDQDGSGGEPCLDAEVLASYADGGLSAAARAEAERHLAVCGWCRRALAFQVEADPDRVVVAAEADAEMDAVAVAAGAATPAELTPAPKPGKVIAWPGVRRAARTWLPLAATLIVGAGLWFSLGPGRLRPSPALPAQTSSASDATRAPESEQQPKTDAFDSKDRSRGEAAQVALGGRLQEAGADAKQKVATSSPRPFGAGEANRALHDAPAPAQTPAPQSLAAARAAQAEDARAGAAPASAPPAPAASAPAASPTFRSGVPVSESTLARAKTESQAPAPARSNANATPNKPQGNAAASGVVGGVVAEVPARAREADAIAGRQAQAGQQAGQPQAAVDRVQPAQQARVENVQVAVNAAPNTAVNQSQIVSGPTNAQSNVATNAQTNTAGQNATGQNAANQGAAGQKATQSPAAQNAVGQNAAGQNAGSPGAAGQSPTQSPAAQNAAGQNAGNQGAAGQSPTQNAGTQNAGNQSAANQRGASTGDRGDRDESRRLEAPQRAANESSAPAPAPPPAAAPTFGVAADASKAAAPPATPTPAAGGARQEAAKAGAPSNTAGAGSGARSTEAAEGKVANVASKPTTRAGEAGAGAKPADGEPVDKPTDAVAKRAAASPPPPPAAPAARAPRGGRGLDPERVTVTSPFPNVVRSVVNTRRWWRIRDGNTIEGSFDGGFTWTVEYSDPEARIARAAVTRTDDCWMVGAKGLVLRFERGRGWTRVTSPTTRALVSITPTSARAALVTDESGQTYQTTDGGLTWRSARR